MSFSKRAEILRARLQRRLDVRVFLAVASVRAEYGGPAYSVSRLAIALSAAGLEVGLWTPDQSVAATSLLGDSGVARLSGTLVEAITDFGHPDIVHDNGIWLPHNHRLAGLCAERRIPRVVSIRGMLEPWALRHKRWKKRVAWAVYQRRDLKRADVLHAAAAQEAASIRTFQLGVPLRVIPNGVDLPDISAEKVTRASTDGSSPRTALFLGRLYPVKGLPMLIAAWGRAKPEGWHLRIVGPDEAGHRNELLRAVERAGVGEHVTFAGAVSGAQKSREFAAADLLVLPTLSESFGMVVAEALAHGVPVVTTTAAPWPQLEERGCGWVVPPEPAAIEAILRKLSSVDSRTLASMGEKGRELVAGEFTWARAADGFRELYSAAVTGSAA